MLFEGMRPPGLALGCGLFAPGDRSIFPPMSKPGPRSTLYRLIEAGQLAAQALISPLSARGLMPGDDALLFVLHRTEGATPDRLGRMLEEDETQVADRLERLAARGLTETVAVGSDLVPGARLTEDGEALRALLADIWSELEEALLGEFPPRRRKTFAMTLRRIAKILRS
jgi:DNA-binding MarR family transcriptional regulator